MSHKKLRGIKEKGAAYIYIHKLEEEKMVSGIVFCSPYGSVRYLQCFDGPGIGKFVSYIESNYRDVNIKDISIYYDTEGADIDIVSTIHLNITRKNCRSPYMDKAKDIAFSTKWHSNVERT